MTGCEHTASLVCVGSVCGIRTSLLGAEHFRGWALRRGTVILEAHIMASLCSSAKSVTQLIMQVEFLGFVI